MGGVTVPADDHPPTRPKCPGCREAVRPEDDFTRDDVGGYWHLACLEDD
jgi:hypothetical protein